VLVKVGGQVIDTGLRQFGAVVGDDAQTGCNAVLNPGTLVGPRSLIYPSAAITGVVPPDTIVKLRAPIEYAQRAPVQAPGGVRAPHQAMQSRRRPRYPGAQ
jgi:hypothetical protein